jgi:hypothetical protein
VKAPQTDSDQSVVFSGIVPGGFSGVLQPYTNAKSPGRLLTLTFKVKQKGKGTVSLRDVQLLANDGKGTPVDVTVQDFNWQATETASQPIETVKQPASEISKTITGATLAEDKDAPENFNPQLIKDPNLFAGQWSLVFATSDAKSGIDHYEVQESLLSAPNEGDWQSTSSPYLLQDQSLRRYIFVKAVDRSGNSRVAVLPPSYPASWYEKNIIWFIITILISVAAVSGLLLWHHSQLKKLSK